MQKPTCPSCGERRGIPFVHGEVSNPDEIARAERDEIALCGCALSAKDPDWHCPACSHRWRARGTKAKKKSSDVLLREMMEGLRKYGLPARARMMAAKDIAGRLAPMGVFRGWANHFLLPRTMVDLAFELTDFWAENPEAASRLEVPREIRARLEVPGPQRPPPQLACFVRAAGVMNVLTAAHAAHRRTHVKAFTIENESNNIVIHASLREAEAVPNAERFDSEAALAKLAANWPSARLTEIWNSLPGETPVKKFKDRTSAVTRIWKAIQNLSQASPAVDEVGRPEMTPPISDHFPVGADGLMQDYGQTPQSGDAAQSEVISASDDPVYPVSVTAAVRQTPDAAHPTPHVKSKRARAKKTSPAAFGNVSAPREGTKTSGVIAMLRREGGVTVEEIMTTMGWQKHTTRALLSAGGSLAKKHGLVITSDRIGDRRMYSVKS